LSVKFEVTKFSYVLLETLKYWKFFGEIRNEGPLGKGEGGKEGKGKEKGEVGLLFDTYD
jgi:predicted transposase YdaD